MARKELRPEDVTAIYDTREQLPWDLSPLKMVRGTLSTADYSVVGLTHEIAIERKSLSDLLGVIGGGRERFDREIERLRGFPTRALIVEATWQQFCAGEWRQRVHPNAAMGSVMGWIERGIPVIFAGDSKQAALCCSRMLFIAANRRFRQLGGFYDSLKISS